MTIVLYNLRVAFFLMCYLNRELDVRPTDFVQFLIEHLAAKEGGFTSLRRGVALLKQVKRLILDNQRSMLSIGELGNVTLSPHAAVLFDFLQDLSTLYVDLREVTQHFCAQRSLHLSEDLLDDILTYQKARMRSWPEPAAREYILGSNIAAYFAKLCAGEEPPKIVRQEQRIRAQVPPDYPMDLADFGANLVQGGHTAQILEVAILDNQGHRPRKSTAK